MSPIGGKHYFLLLVEITMSPIGGNHYFLLLVEITMSPIGGKHYFPLLVEITIVSYWWKTLFSPSGGNNHCLQLM